MGKFATLAADQDQEIDLEGLHGFAHYCESQRYADELRQAVLDAAMITFGGGLFERSPEERIADEMDERDMQSLVRIVMNHKSGRYSADEAMHRLTQIVEQAITVVSIDHADQLVGK